MNKEMRLFLVVALAVCFLWGCNGASNRGFRHYHIFYIEFINHFEDDTLLVRVEAIERDEVYGIFRREYIYVYDDDNQLVSRSEYRIEVDGARELFHQQIFSQNKETRICFKDNDTIRFKQTFFDERDNLIECYRRISDWLEHSHVRRLLRYNDDDEHIRTIWIDYIRQTTTIITFSRRTRGDTLITRRYANGEFLGVTYTILLDENRIIEYDYDANNFLVLREEITIEGEYETFISVFYDENARRSGVGGHITTTVYRNGRMIEDISRLLCPAHNQKIRRVIDYDERGNRVRKVVETWWD